MNKNILQDIATLWYCDSSLKKLSFWFLTQVQALSELFIKQREPNKGRSVPSLLWNALRASGQVSFNMAAQKHVQIQLVISLHVHILIICTSTKHMVHSFLTTLLCLSVVCNDVSYHVSYHIIAAIYMCNVKWPPSVSVVLTLWCFF